MESGKIQLIKCFLTSNSKAACDRSCRIGKDRGGPDLIISFSQISTLFRNEPQKYPIPLELLEIPLRQECESFSRLILIGECAVHRKSMEKIHSFKKESALLLCFCPDSVTEPKIVKKLADLIEQLCIKQIKLILAHESCCQIGNMLIEKAKAILEDASIDFSTEIA